jgi:biopolymer transport protein ExbB
MGVVVSDAVQTAGVTVVLWLLSASSWVVIVYKTWWLWRVHHDVGPAQNAYWQSTDPQQACQALRVLDRHGVLVSLVSQGGVEFTPHASRERVDRPDPTFNQRRLLHSLRAVAQQVQWGQAWLACVAMAAPLLGLLGTVSGLLEVLQALPDSTPEAWTQWVPGLSQTLRHTAAGLWVAVPALFAHHLFASRLQMVQQEIDDFAADLIDRLNQDSPA